MRNVDVDFAREWSRPAAGRTLSASSFWTAASFSDLTPKRPFTDAAASVNFARSRITCTPMSFYTVDAAHKLMASKLDRPPLTPLWQW